MTSPYLWRRPVLKFGTSTLTAGSVRLSLAKLSDLVEQIAALHAAGLQPIVVSSGAVAVGRQQLGFPAARKDIGLKQVLAAVGQSRLMHLYEGAFDFHDITCAQILLTREDLAERQRYLNARNTLLALCERGVVPIINENDVVAADEIKVGDNDRLSALVATLVEADLLVLVTDMPGLYNADPAIDPNAMLVPEVPIITPEVAGWAAGSQSGLGTGGMATKIEAARIATAAGTEVRIVDGREGSVLLRTLRGEPMGTRFLARSDRVEGRKRWILSGLHHPGRLTVDAGAARALLSGGASLLPAGIVAVEGEFEQGDTVQILAPDGEAIAAGISNYPAADIHRIRGQRSSEIERILNYSYGDSVVHRDNLAALVRPERNVHAL